MPTMEEVEEKIKLQETDSVNAVPTHVADNSVNVVLSDVPAVIAARQGNAQGPDEQALYEQEKRKRENYSDWFAAQSRNFPTDLRSRGVYGVIIYPLYLLEVVLLAPLLFGLLGMSAHHEFSWLLMPICAIAWLAAIISGFSILFQVPLVSTWAFTLKRLHQGLAFQTKKSYPIGPLKASLAGYFISPALPAFAWIVFAITMSLINGQVFWGLGVNSADKLIAHHSLTILTILFTVNGAASLGAFSNGIVLSKMIGWLEKQKAVPARLKATPYLVPIALVGPFWMCLWTFPHWCSIAFLLLFPIAGIFAFNRLAEIVDEIHKAIGLEQYGPQRKHPVLSDVLPDLKLIAFIAAIEVGIAIYTFVTLKTLFMAIAPQLR